MRYPSIKSIERDLTSRYTHEWLSPHLAARCIREAMETLPVTNHRNKPSAMQVINDLLGLNGVEYIPEGRNSRSPAILYCNAGDPYDVTMLYVNGSYRIGCWGDIVERGDYD